MVFVTGDKHGSLQLDDLSAARWPEGQTLSKADYVIIMGDFGGVFFGDHRDDEVLAFYDAQPWTTLFIDGNHENHDLLDKFPVECWNGGNIHRITNSVIHLMRGQYFSIQGHTFFTMGGASSIDKDRRIPGKSWWPQELPSYSELENATKVLAAHGNCVDYMLTHCCSIYQWASFSHQRPFDFKKDLLTDYLDEWEHSINFTHWYYGHFHEDLRVDEKHTQLCRDVIRII